ncbi:Methionine aminopeptidase 2-1 [Exophiala mesophila]|uniref:Methionine aminopeptidase 2 n=1 Tax=Exophiala mesophila TaxID=212818 RepID=A0A438NDH4_EXOME|nr:Methionine aminopeptidase 2-1 [Exophiala mesophila]
MGTKTPQNGNHWNNDGPPNANEAGHLGGEARGAHMSRDGDGSLGEGGGDDDSDGDGDDNAHGTNMILPQASVSPAEATKPQKKRKKSKKKKKAAGLPQQQTSPPSILLADLFPSGIYPEGEVQQYSKASVHAAERRYDITQLSNDDVFLQNYRQAAEVHRQTRKWVQDTVRPGQSLLDIAEGIENSVRTLLGHAGLDPGDSLNAGMGFPTGLCLNHQVAHYTPNPGQKDVILQQEDVMKVDFGVHINGWIVDSAFTMAFDHTYDTLLTAVAGIDVRICDVSAEIQETMESYEVEVRGKTYPIKPVRNITAHNIKQWRIHGGKSIPFIKNSDQTKMEAGEVFAIETFGTTGRGYLRDDVGIYGYGLNDDAPLRIHSPLPSAKRLHKTIRENFGTVVFCRRYLERLGVDKYLMNQLISNGVVEPYQPLMDIKGSNAAQFEHTLILRETHKEILSRGDDY